MLLSFAPAPAVAASPGNPDQFNGCGPYDTGGADDLAQTFTAGKSGTLTGVDLWLDGSGSVSLKLETTSAGRPSGTLLAATSLSYTTTDRRIRARFTFSPAPSVGAGNSYALVFTTSGLICGSLDTYSGGRAWTDGGVEVVAVAGSDLGAGQAAADPQWTPLEYPADFAFQTYVDDGTPVNPTPLTTEPLGQPFTFAPKANPTPPLTATDGESSSPAAGQVVWFAGLAVSGGILAFLIVGDHRRRRGIIARR
jgi:hypothetical protein